MPWTEGSRMAIAIIIAAVIIGAFIYYGMMYQAVPTPEPIVYKEDLKCYFNVYDATSGSLLTSDIVIEFYKAGENPFARTFTGVPIAQASYDTTEGAWRVILDAGKYVVLVKDAKASKTLYPALYTVEVKGLTESEFREYGGKTWLNPQTLYVYQRASPSITVSIKAYDSSTGAWVSVSDINITAYDKWIITYEISLSGLNTVLKAGRLYLPKHDGLTYSMAWIDGSQAAIYYDDSSEDDGWTGYYVPFNDWTVSASGVPHRIEVMIEETGTPSTGTLTATLVDYYVCQAVALIWWSYVTASASVTS